MKIQITADSTCDLSPTLLSECGIRIMPLAVTKGGNAYLDGVNISPSEIFQHVDGGGSLCVTSARNPEEYNAAFQSWAKEADAVVHISLGSSFSSSYKNAVLGAQPLSNVYVVDSKNLSTGQGHIVLEACKLAAHCRSVEGMVAKLEALTAQVDASFLINRLDYMVKGGRCSSAAALGANLLSLKPCIEVVNGSMRVCKKYRGSFERCIQAYIRERLSKHDIWTDRLFITYTAVPPSVLQAVLETVNECAHFSHIYETRAGCTVSCHCGPGTLGILFIRGKNPFGFEIE
ncbi:MAG: DegV family protein [Candidatus Pelethousia sp.]|nr:DegV family protein [Candidatus Pelethousia sp.]